MRAATMTPGAVYRDEIDGSDRVEVVADVSVAGRPDAKLEKIVLRLGVETGVYGVSRKIVPTTDAERELVAAA